MIKNYGEPEKWIFATNEEMFRMQPQRIIEQLDRKTLNELVDMIYIIDKNNIKSEFKNI